MDGSPGVSADIKDFLVTRRAKITPQQVGLPGGPRRRVPGLRREEVAMLAGVSAEYYVQIERGNVTGVSDEVLHAVAEALRLDDAETVHLFDLVRSASRRTARRGRRTTSAQVPEGVQALMDAMTGAPAIVYAGNLDVLAANALGRALYAPVFERASVAPPNLARFMFLDDGAADVFPDWDKAADDTVAMLRVEAGRLPSSRALTDLIGELATRSEEFGTRWAAHDVRLHRRGVKQFRHEVVGDLELRFEALDVAGLGGVVMIGFTAEAGSASAEALQLLASWTAPSPRDGRSAVADRDATTLD